MHWFDVPHFQNKISIICTLFSPGLGLPYSIFHSRAHSETDFDGSHTPSRHRENWGLNCSLSARWQKFASSVSIPWKLPIPLAVPNRNDIRRCPFKLIGINEIREAYGQSRLIHEGDSPVVACQGKYWDCMIAHIDSGILVYGKTPHCILTESRSESMLED